MVLLEQYLSEIQLAKNKNPNIEKITFKVVQMKFLAMHIANQKISVAIFMIDKWQTIFMEHDFDFT